MKKILLTSICLVVCAQLSAQSVYTLENGKIYVYNTDKGQFEETPVQRGSELDPDEYICSEGRFVLRIKKWYQLSPINPTFDSIVAPNRVQVSNLEWRIDEGESVAYNTVNKSNSNKSPMQGIAYQIRNQPENALGEAASCAIKSNASSQKDLNKDKSSLVLFNNTKTTLYYIVLYKQHRKWGVLFDEMVRVQGGLCARCFDFKKFPKDCEFAIVASNNTFCENDLELILSELNASELPEVNKGDLVKGIYTYTLKLNSQALK